MSFLDKRNHIINWLICVFIYLFLFKYWFIYPHLPEKYLVSLKIVFPIAIIPLAVIIFIPDKSKYIWVKRICVYFTVMVASLFLACAMLYYSKNFFNATLNNTNIDNARYLLSSLIQSEAAIVAIVITLTLVAVQQTSSSYSTRLIHIFKNKNPDFWILIMIYLGSIIYGLTILTSLNEKVMSEGHIFIAYFLGLLSLISLIPYMLHTIDLLKPSTMMMFLAENITINNILSIEPKHFRSVLGLCNPILNDKGCNENNKDPLLPIVDIINSSLMKHDYDTSIEGLSVLIKYSLNILERDKIKEEEFNIIFDLFTKHFDCIAKLAIYKNDNKCIDLVLHWFYHIAMISVERQKDIITLIAVNSIGEIGKIAAENRNKRVVVLAYRYLQAIIDTASEVNIKLLRRGVCIALSDIGEICAEYKIRGMYFDILEPLFTIIYRAFTGVYNECEDEYEEEYEEDNEDEEYEQYIKELGMPPDDMVMLALKGICAIGEKLFEMNMTDDLKIVTQYITVIKKLAQKYEREDALDLIDNFCMYTI